MPPILDTRATNSDTTKNRHYKQIHRSKHHKSGSVRSREVPDGKELTCLLWEVKSAQPTTCRTQPGGQCFSLIQDYVDPDTDTWQTERMYGCRQTDQSIFAIKCRSDPANGSNAECCSSGDYCNQHLLPEYPGRSNKDLYPQYSEPTTTQTPVIPKTQFFDLTTGLVLAATVSVFLLAIVLLLVIWCRRRRVCCKNPSARQPTVEAIALKVLSPQPIVVLQPQTTPSPILAAPHRLKQRTIIAEITQTRLLGNGRFGECWLAQFQGDRVAMKIFRPDAGAWCQHEADIYRTVIMDHENIQRYIASDVDVRGHQVMLTTYHEQGSLHVVLSNAERPLRPPELCQLAYSLTAGIAFLHMEFASAGPSKPIIVHGDLNARNVLVRRGTQCVIADLGCAIKYPKTVVGGAVEPAMLPPVAMQPADWRYVAPEGLAGTLDKTDLYKVDLYKSVDMYAAGMLYWQMARCCATETSEASGEETDECEGYAMPFDGILEVPDGSRADREVVRRLVCDEKRRPELPERWERSGDKMLRAMRAIVTDCWKENASGRLTVFPVKTMLAKLRVDPVV